MAAHQPSTWRTWAGYAGMTVLVTITLAVTAILVNRAFFSDPPVHVVSMDPEDLGVLCPDQTMVLNNRVTIDAPVVLFYYLSTMDADGLQNIIDTQTTFPGRPHPRPATFHQLLPWEVPDLPPGKYKRVLAVRGTDGDENPVIIEATFEIGTECD